MNQPISFTTDEVVSKMQQLSGREFSPMEKMHVELMLLKDMALQQVMQEKQMMGKLFIPRND